METRWRSMKSAPKDGTRALWFIDFGDGDPAVYFVGKWKADRRGFNICDDDAGAWHIRGVKAWMPLPKPPSMKEEKR